MLADDFQFEVSLPWQHYSILRAASWYDALLDNARRRNLWIPLHTLVLIRCPMFGSIVVYVIMDWKIWIQLVSANTKTEVEKETVILLWYKVLTSPWSTPASKCTPSIGLFATERVGRCIAIELKFYIYVYIDIHESGRSSHQYSSNMIVLWTFIYHRET